MPALARDRAVLQPTPVEGVELLRAHFVDHAFERHSHATWSIGVTFAGRQTFRCRGTTATSRRGNVIVFRPDDAHDGHGEDEAGFRYAMLYLDDARVEAWLRAGGSTAPGAAFPQALIHDPLCAHALARAVRAVLQPGESLRGATLLAEAVLALFARHARHRPAALPERATARWLQRVREYLDAHYAGDVRVEDLADLAGVSRVHVTRAFTAAFGLPPHLYLNGVRVRAAARLIDGGARLADAAAAAGFADQSHLTRRFKGTFGVTPAAWARRSARADR